MMSVVALAVGMICGDLLADPPPTFNRDIAPIILAQCAECHHAGSAAPFPLVTYDDVKKKARMIAKVTLDNYMPPWAPQKTAHEFIGERGLTPAQIELIQKWVASGAPEDDPAHPTAPPASPHFEDQKWMLGKPDLVLTLDESFDAPPAGIDVLRTFVFGYQLFENNVRLRAIEFHPENPKLIHHASFLIDTTGTAAMLDHAQPGAGYDGMGDIGLNQAGTLGAWSPGSGPFEYPAGVSAAIPPHGDFVVETHINPTGKVEPVKFSVGLYFDRNTENRSAAAITLGSQQIDIPAGERNFRVVDDFTLPVGVDVIGLMPHAHFACQRIRVDTIAPDGATETLLKIDDWDFNFMQPLEFAKPVCLPAETKLRVEFTYDNSADNPQNPFSPPRRILLGERARDEMALMFVYLVAASDDDQARLQAAHKAAQLQRIEAGKAFRARQAASVPASDKK